MRKYVAYVQMYANFWICGICGMIFAYAILIMPLYVEKICNMRVLAKYAVTYKFDLTRSHWQYQCLLHVSRSGIVFIIIITNFVTIRYCFTVIICVNTMQNW